MPLSFRNLRVTPDEPVGRWPTEAVRTALERGDLAHWRLLAAEVRREPWGRTARQIEEVLAHQRPYGIAEAIQTVIARARRAAEEAERAEVAAEIRDAVARSGLSQRDFATRIGTSASRLSTYATGRVTPSAALMVRIRRAAKASPFLL